MNCCPTRGCVLILPLRSSLSPVIRRGFFCLMFDWLHGIVRPRSPTRSEIIRETTNRPARHPAEQNLKVAVGHVIKNDIEDMSVGPSHKRPHGLPLLPKSFVIPLRISVGFASASVRFIGQSAILAETQIEPDAKNSASFAGDSRNAGYSGACLSCRG